MDGSNWRPAGQIQPQTEPQAPPSAMDAGDWRTHLQPDSRQRIVNKIMDTLKRHLPVSGQEGLNELQKIAVRFEEKVYSAASSQSDYLRRISLKMLTMETKSQNPTMSSSIPPNQLGVGKNPPGPAQVMAPPSANNQTQSLSNQLANNQSQSRPPLLSQNIQNNITTPGVQSSAGLPSSTLPVSGLTQSPLQNSNMQNISGISQNPIGNSMGQGGPSNMFSGSQRPVQGRQLPQQVSSQQHQQQQSQNSQHYHFQQQLQQQLLKPKFQQGNANHPLMQSHIQKQQQQQQQQNHLQPNQLQSSQQSLQPSMMQSAPLSNLQQNQQSSVQQHQQAVLRQQQQPQQVPIMHQQQTPVAQSSLLPSQQQQQQQLIGQQPNATIMQQNPLIVQQNNVSDMQPQQQQQQQRLLGQQSNISNLQQQQLMAQQNNLSIGHQQQLVSASNVSGVQQQQQLLGNQSGNSMQISHHSSHVLHQSKVPMQQQTQHGTSTLLPTQGQQSQAQPQLMSHIQTQPGQIQQQMNMQQQPPNLLQRDIQQRLQTPGVLAQTQNVVDQQKQLFQSQRAAPEAPATSLDSTAHTVNVNGSDWQEEVYQKIKTMKEMYLSELTEIYQKISAKLQQQESLPQQPKQIDRFRIYKNMLEHLLQFLQLPKGNITPSLKEKLGYYEKQIVTLLQTNNRPRKPVPMQQGQVPSMHTMQQAQQTQSQITQVQPHENQMNPQLQSMSSQMPQNNATIMQPGMASLSSGPPGQQSMLTSFQVGHNLDSGQGNAPGSLQQVSVDSLQQNSVSAQQSNINVLTSQSGVNVLPSNMNPLHSNANMLQHQQLKQHPDQQMTPQVKQQFQQQRQIQLMQKQMLQQQQQHQQQPPLSQQPKQQQPSQMQAPQMPQLHQMNDANDLKLRQGIGVKQGIFQQQHSAASQRPAYHHQQMKVAPFPISSPQLLQAVSPQIPQHSSPQMDQQGLLTSFPKTGTPLQPANSPFVPSPSTPLTSSPVPGESDKPNSGVSTLSNAVNLANQQTTGPAAPAPSLAIGTPGISASPLLAEFTSPDGNHGVVVTAVPEKSSVTQQPLERLIQVVKSMSPKALNASVNDIGSVVSMIDRIAGSAPGNGSRAAVGEDLVAMTKSRLHARNIASQDGISGTKKMRRYTSAMPLNVGSSASSVNDSFKNLVGSETSDLESTATSNIKQPKFEANRALLEEIRMINQCLIDTVVGVSDETASAVVTAEGAVGTIVNCSFTAVALSPNLKSQYASSQMSLIQPLRLLVPANYPNCSPILLDKVPVEVIEHEDLSAKAKSRFSISLRSLSQPTSLGEIARTWDVCARAIISEYAQQSGGGSFSSKYGTWENCLSAA